MEDIKCVDFTINGKCSNCGECCTNCLPMSDNEISRIKAYIRKHKIKEQRHNGLVGVDMTCPFRDNTNRKCLIYPVRPAVCRQFLCNKKYEDIEETKVKFHKQNRVVFMRSEFYGNFEDSKFFAEVMRGYING